jgi:hypothetical protein
MSLVALGVDEAARAIMLAELVRRGLLVETRDPVTGAKLYAATRDFAVLDDGAVLELPKTSNAPRD